MSDVTDCAFRQMIAQHGKPDVIWTEFVSANGLVHAKGKDKLLIDLKFSKKEHPIVVQLFGSNTENMRKASALCKKLGFDGIDINMGCPDKSIEKQGAGAALMKNLKLAREIIHTVQKDGKGLPVSVKTRIGYNKNEIETWVKGLLKENLAALIIHLRTRKEMSNGPAHWELMKRIVEIRDELGYKTLIIGNGDVQSLEEAKQKVRETGCDGIMIGRAVFGNPWFFNQKPHSLKFSAPAPFADPGEVAVGPSGTKNLREFSFIQEKLEVLVEHTQIFEKELSKPKHKNFSVMKKHFKAYVNDFKGAKELRVKLMKTKNAKEVEKIINDFLNKKNSRIMF